MNRLSLQRISVAFFAGVFGSAVIIAVAASMQVTGLMPSIGLGGFNVLDKAYIYRSLTWGGLWGFALLLPVLEARSAIRGLVLSLFVTAALFFIFMPLATVDGVGPGIAGMNVGIGLPIFAIIVNGLWGLAAGLFFGTVAPRQSPALPAT